MTNQQTTTALLVGATGLVGSHCLRLLLASDRYARVTVVGRRPTGLSHPKLVEHCLAALEPFEALEPVARGDDVFCCLGTTLRQAGSREAFRRVDYDAVVAVAKAALAHGARQFLLVSALATHASSPVFYSRVKGEAEAAVKALPFAACHIFRPSLLLGHRQPPRLGETIAGVCLSLLRPCLRGPLQKYRAIEARDVAVAMVETARREQPSATFESDAIAAIAAAAASGVAGE